MSSKTFFQKIEKAIDDVIFSVSVLVSNFAGLGLEAKIEIETGLGLGKISRSRSRSWSRTSRSRLQPCHSGWQSKIWGALPLPVPPLATSLIWRGLYGVVPSDPSKLCAYARAHSFQRLRTDILLTDTLLHMGCSSSIAHISHFKKSAHTHQNFCKQRPQKIGEKVGGTLKPS